MRHPVCVQDARFLEIALDDMNYDEESENEMIQLADLAELKSLAKDEGRYKPLHSHVKYYNERYAESKKQYSNFLPFFQPRAKELFNLEQEGRSFIAGFKHDLDKYFLKTTKNATVAYTTSASIITDKSLNNIRVKREEIENHYGRTSNEEMDFFQMRRDKNIMTNEAETTEYFVSVTQDIRAEYGTYEYVGQEVTSEDTKDILKQSSILEENSVLVDTENPDEEPYDFEKFKMEYEQQVKNDIKRGKALNYTEKEKFEDTPKGALKRIMDWKRPKNCTKEEMSQIGIKTIKCLVYDYQHMKDMASAKKILWRTWLILRVWLLIYICLAIICWCQTGWCCCCFRCKFCFPRKRILFAKQYYAINPPGTFVKDSKKEGDIKESIRYEFTEYEHDAYEIFEAAIKNI